MRLTAALVVTGLMAAGACGSSGDDASSTSTTTTARTALVSTSTTSASQATEPPATATTAVVSDAATIWPPPDGGMSFDDPVKAVTSFATDLVGFTGPVVGEFIETAPGAGEVAVRPADDGPITSVVVRQGRTDANWRVVSASTPNLRLVSPTLGAKVSSPVHLSGTSTAFEAQFVAEVRLRAAAPAIGEASCMGGANGEIGPFDCDVAFDAAGNPAGVVVLLTRSAKDGNVSEATVVGVTF